MFDVFLQSHIFNHLTVSDFRVGMTNIFKKVNTTMKTLSRAFVHAYVNPQL